MSENDFINPPLFPRREIEEMPISLDNLIAFKTFFEFPEVDKAKTQSPFFPKAESCLENIFSNV